ncbi:enoyl-CoA hydratase/isomerase family protein [Nocardia cyriacigeorgica]|uniref:enoyl-CoA hydratase-related protein n=1 Tax=Nocardia cyriacigeorgica TaxID=135487 RepID=UPI0002D59647|nr:enoyl-CoA hydratase-related protein [Nocardia cyriacigeorgica]MBF6101778.1 enoyl-CoA hydratase/isomerase family protein [Nocardia cyriacigeorgica]MBF6319124.1 enoyl-CoA hydratase/isomerase family protein [Nocardia cyriacigeorgica]MBF6531365.1 enoyl-CoA hydratase/isomerase family protein [Nocardia cyriacigeorgica]TLF56710.1 enoyl-CoA hydratase [Nocardia cyriacigeorgica]
MAEFVTVDELDGDTGRRVAVLRIARAPMNLLNIQVVRELATAAHDIGEDPGIGAVVVYGDERVFCAGDDLAELAALSAEQAAAVAADLQHALGCLARLPQPTVAAISGYALGSGLELALGADRRVIGDNVKLGLPQIKAGLIPLAGIRRLTALIGPGAAKDLVYTGRFVEPDEARALGLVDEVVAPDDVYTAAVGWARGFLDGPARALAAAKAVFEAGPHGHDRARIAWSELFGTEDRLIGTRSYLADGPGSAEFVGR